MVRFNDLNICKNKITSQNSYTINQNESLLIKIDTDILNNFESFILDYKEIDKQYITKFFKNYFLLDLRGFNVGSYAFKVKAGNIAQCTNTQSINIDIV